MQILSFIESKKCFSMSFPNMSLSYVQCSITQTLEILSKSLCRQIFYNMFGYSSFCSVDYKKISNSALTILIIIALYCFRFLLNVFRTVRRPKSPRTVNY